MNCPYQEDEVMTNDWRNKGPELERARAELARWCSVTKSYTLDQCKEVFQRSSLSPDEVNKVMLLPPNEIRDIAGEILFGTEYED